MPGPSREDGAELPPRALARGVRGGLREAGFVEVGSELTSELVDVVHSAIVKAVEPA